MNTSPPGPQRPVWRDADDTQLATQVARNPGDYLDERADIGRAVAPGVRELFIACEVGIALQQQFEHLPQPFVAVHDLGCQATGHLLSSIALATGRAGETLVIRRTGYGTVLASIDYVDCHTPAGPVRLYSTAVDADTQTRQAITRVLLDHAPLSVVLVGEHPAHVLEGLFTELRATASTSSGGHHELLFLPLGSPVLLQPRAQAFANVTARTVRLGPQVATPAEAWRPLRAAWNALPGPAAALPAMPSPDAEQTTAPLTRPLVPSPSGTLPSFMHQVGALPGVVCAGLFEIATSRVLDAFGPRDAATELARRGTLLLAAAATSRRQLGLVGPALELVVHGSSQGNAVHVLARRPDWALHLVYTPALADWPQLRQRIEQIEAALPRHTPS